MDLAKFFSLHQILVWFQVKVLFEEFLYWNHYYGYLIWTYPKKSREVDARQVLGLHELLNRSL